jgi:A/G-specific adenine glycosylase
VKKTSMLLLLRDGEVLLEKRPMTGVWGGLWCLPERDDAAGKKLPVLRHEFTHFTLDITPILRELGSASPQAAEPGQIWLPVEEAIGAAVPAPVRKLLVALDSGRLLGESLALEETLQD